MSKKQLKLFIPTPCTEDWNTMTATQSGKFCASCQKTVIDFSRMSDTEIIHYFSDFKGETCGRLTEKQLNSVIAEPLVLKPNYRWAWALPALLLPTVAASQTVKTTELKTISTPSVFETKSVDGTIFLTIVGEVKELGGSFMPIDGAIVAVNINDKIVAYAQTDSLGIFSLNLSKNYDNQRFSLDISQIGFEKEQLLFDNFKAIKDNRLFISLANAPIEIGDAVVCTGYHTSTNVATGKMEVIVSGELVIVDKPNFFHRPKFRFKNLFRKKKRD